MLKHRFVFSTLLTALVAVVSVFSAASALADSAVWKVSKGSDYFYLGGSAHLLPASDFPLPAPYQRAFADSDVLVLETELPKTPQAQQEFISMLQYSDGRTLQQVLSADVYRQLADYLTANGANLNDLQRFTPGFILMLATQIESQKIGIAGEGVDAYFQQQAENAEKPIWFLEALSYQAQVLAELGQGDEDDFVVRMLAEVPEAGQVLQDTIAAGRSGDLATIQRVVNEPMLEDDPASYQALFTQRNDNWMRKLLGYFRNAQREFVLVGAGHLAGDDGLIAQLKAQGFVVQQLP